MSDSRTPLGTITARLEERILQPLRVNAFARRTWFSVTLALVVCVYAATLAWMLWRDAANPPKAEQAQETPVEVVAEMPKPPPTPTPPTPPQKQEAEKPASSAPRAFNDAKDDEHEDKETHAPKAADKPPEPAPQPVQEAAQAPAEPPSAAPADKPEDAPPVEKKVEVPDKEAEALDKAPPEPPKKPQKLAQAKPTPPKPKPRPAKSAAQQLAGASQLPDFTFAKPMRKHAKVTGGTEDDRYLAVVYALITQNRRPISYPYGDWAVAVSFVVDGGGNLVGAQVSRSSGIPEVDSEAVAAVEEAAPFPPPPSGNNTGMVARLRSGTDQASAGDR